MKDAMPSVGVIVGRFQVPELHDGHLELIRTVKSLHNRVAIFVGLSPTKNATKRHPLDFETRRRMIQAKFPDITVLPLQDRRTDEEWSADLDKQIANLQDWGTVFLYGSRSSFVPHYKGRFAPKEIVLVCPASGTDIRAALTNSVKESYDFRAGIIYATNNRRPRVETTVDIAILYDNAGETLFLMARKPGFSGWRFPGGFAETTSSSFEEDVRREAYEETNLDVSSLQYCGSAEIHDWRYVPETDSIKSLFFVGWASGMMAKAQDDICEVKWFHLSPGLDSSIVPEHRNFYHMLVRKYYKSNSEASNELAASDR